VTDPSPEAVGEARWPAAGAAGDPGRISRRSRLLRAPSLALVVARAVNVFT
jgi:hypothetical protein